MKERIVLLPIDSSKKEPPGAEVKFDVFNQFYVPFTGSNILFAFAESGNQVAIKIPARKRGANREWAGLNKAYDAGIPVPRPIILGETAAGMRALVSEKIEGEQLYRLRKRQLKNQLGMIVSRMHNKTQIKGKEWDQSRKPGFEYYDQYIFQWLKGDAEELKKGTKTEVILQRLSDSMREYYRHASPVFNHNDIHDGQLIVKKGGQLVLFDFENWKEESKLNELATYLFHSIRTERAQEGFEEFIEGYLGGLSLTENEKETLVFSLLFISARTVSYFQSKDSNYLETAKTNHQKVLGYIDSEELWKKF